MDYRRPHTDSSDSDVFMKDNNNNWRRPSLGVYDGPPLHPPRYYPCSEYIYVAPSEPSWVYEPRPTYQYLYGHGGFQSVPFPGSTTTWPTFQQTTYVLFSPPDTEEEEESAGSSAEEVDSPGLQYEYVKHGDEDVMDTAADMPPTTQLPPFETSRYQNTTHDRSQSQSQSQIPRITRFQRSNTFRAIGNGINALKSLTESLMHEKVKLHRERLESERLHDRIDKMLRLMGRGEETRSHQRTAEFMYETLHHWGEDDLGRRYHVYEPVHQPRSRRQADNPYGHGFGHERPEVRADRPPLFPRVHPVVPAVPPVQPAQPPQSTEDASADLQTYNDAWAAVFAAVNANNNSSPSQSAVHQPIQIPWPVKGLRAANLSKLHPSTGCIPNTILNDPFKRQKWNAFSFFVRAFGLQPRYFIPESGPWGAGDNNNSEEPVFYVDRETASQDRLGKLKAQMNQEKLRWHADRLKRMGVTRFSNEEEECAKAVWSAVLDASKACGGGVG